MLVRFVNNRPTWLFKRKSRSWTERQQFPLDPLDLIVADCAVMWLSENWVNFYLAQHRGWSSRWRLGEVWDYHLICLLLYILVVLECTWISEILQLMLYCITPYFQINHVQKTILLIKPFLDKTDIYTHNPRISNSQRSLLAFITQVDVVRGFHYSNS